MFTLLLTVAEEVTKYTDIITNVISQRFGEIIGIVSIPVLSSIIINQTWATIRGAIAGAKRKKANLEITNKLQNVITKVTEAEDTYTEKIVKTMSSKFEDLEKKYSNRSEEIAKAKNIAINKVLGISDKIKDKTEEVAEETTEKVEVINTKTDEVLDEIVKIGDKEVENINEKIETSSKIANEKLSNISKKVSKKLKKAKEVSEDIIAFER